MINDRILFESLSNGRFILNQGLENLGALIEQRYRYELTFIEYHIFKKKDYDYSADLYAWLANEVINIFNIERDDEPLVFEYMEYYYDTNLEEMVEAIVRTPSQAMMKTYLNDNTTALVPIENRNVFDTDEFRLLVDRLSYFKTRRENGYRHSVDDLMMIDDIIQNILDHYFYFIYEFTVKLLIEKYC